MSAWFYRWFLLLLAAAAPAVALAQTNTNSLPMADLPEALKPPTQGEIRTAIRRGLDFLLASQNRDGSWGSARQTKDLNIYAPVPGAHQAFRAAVTALCVESLIETGTADREPKARAARLRGEEWLLKNLPALRRADESAIYNVWGHAYGIQALAKMYGREADPKRRLRIKEVVLGQVELLQRYESVDGGWAYYDFRIGAQRPASDSLSFVTATVLVACHQARLAGIDLPEHVARAGYASIERQRKQDNSYLYGEYLKWRPMLPVNRPAGSLGRSQACNLALRYWGDKTITDTVLTTWLDKLVERNGWLSMGRKRPVPHESWFQVAGYFYYYGHYYAALCVEELGPKAAAPYQDHLAAILLPLQEKDGSWWDYPFYDYHQPYGTAFALMTLQRCLR